MSPVLLALVMVVQPSGGTPTVGVIADDLVDYSQWAAPHKALWSGTEVAAILGRNGVSPTLLKKEDLTLDGLTS